jgi:hypothetical protein
MREPTTKNEGALCLSQICQGIESVGLIVGGGIIITNESWAKYKNGTLCQVLNGSHQLPLFSENEGGLEK